MDREKHALQQDIWRISGKAGVRLRIRALSPAQQVLIALSLAAVAVCGAQAQTSPPANTTGNCTSSLFGDPACQATSTSDQGGFNTGSPNYQRDPDAQVLQDTQAVQFPQGQGQGGGNGSRLYVDSAGTRSQRPTSPNDSNRQALQVYPPDPVTDLQKLARSATGETVPIFGRDMFQGVPSTFAPADEIPITPDYVLGPGDEVLVRLWGAEQATSNSRLTVDTSGDIYVPRVGTVHVAGLRASELQSRIGAEVNRNFRNYQISVGLGHLRSIQVYVVGEARRPGAYTVSALSTVLNTLFASGGPGVQGSMRHIQVRRAGQVLTEFDLYDLVLRGDKSHDVRLETGDTIFIPHAGPQVVVAGSVRHPAVYELRDSTENSALIAGPVANTSPTTLNDLLVLAGGLSPTAAVGKIRLERIDTSQHRNALTINLDATGRAMPLQDGDILYAEHISLGYRQTVTIRGNLANPGRFAWKPGMRLADIIPDRESLLTNDYWRMRSGLGIPTPLFQPHEYDTEFTSPATTRTSSARGAANGANGNYGTDRIQNPLVASRNSLNSVLPPGEEGTLQQAGLAAGGVISRDSTQQDETATSEADSAREGVGTANTGTANSNVNGPRIPLSLPSNVNSIRIPAPDIDWSYAVVERLDPKTLRTTLLPFHLGKLVEEGDTSQNLELQPNDVVTILNQRDILVPQVEQTRFVRLEGEFVGAGVYSAGPDETLDQLIQRAGGFTPKAYLYGSSFLRESARAFQQQRLDAYITQLSHEMDRATAVRGASSPTGVSDPNALLLERNTISQLRQLRATGRIVLEFAPGSAGISTVPKIPLENGDVFRVPSRPETVSVIGAVYGQNVFLYNEQRHLENYLALAGKPNRFADRDHAFIIRADGSVYSRELAKGFLSNHFDETRINPGDSIVVPEKPIRPTGLRQLLDYSQILSSFGLAAAAINVVK